MWNGHFYCACVRLNESLLICSPGINLELHLYPILRNYYADSHNFSVLHKLAHELSHTTRIPTNSF